MTPLDFNGRSRHYGVDDDYKDEVDQGAVQLLDVAAEADGVELSTVANISCFGQLVLPHPGCIAMQHNAMQRSLSVVSQFLLQ